MSLFINNSRWSDRHHPPPIAPWLGVIPLSKARSQVLRLPQLACRSLTKEHPNVARRQTDTLPMALRPVSDGRLKDPRRDYDDSLMLIPSALG